MDLEGGGGGGSVGGVLSGLASDVAGLKTLEAVGSENKNFHATISKLAKAAEKVRRRVCLEKLESSTDGGAI